MRQTSAWGTLPVCVFYHNKHELQTLHTFPRNYLQSFQTGLWELLRFPAVTFTLQQPIHQLVRCTSQNENSLNTWGETWPLLGGFPLPKSPELSRSYNCHEKWYSLVCSQGFPGGPSGKNPPASVGEVRDTDLIPQLENHGNPLSILAWRIPWTEESGGLQPIVLQRVGHDRGYSACTICSWAGGPSWFGVQTFLTSASLPKLSAKMDICFSTETGSASTSN